MIDLFNWRCTRGNEFNQKGEELIYDVTFTATISDLDERSDWSSSYISRVSKMVETVEFSLEQATLSIGDIKINIDSIDSFDIDFSRCLIDATTLEFPEILYLFRVLSRQKISFDVLYIQPNDYQHDNSKRALGDAISFALSDDGPGPTLLPKYVYPAEDSLVSVALGFEGHRLGSIIQSEEFSYRELVGFIGVPPFKAGWENRTLSNNVEPMRSARLCMETSYRFAAANDPKEMYSQLETSLALAGDSVLHLAPFGTKPSAIAMAWFLINYPRTGVIYDFVRKKKKRSEGTDMVHLWQFEPSS